MHVGGEEREQRGREASRQAHARGSAPQPEHAVAPADHPSPHQITTRQRGHAGMRLLGWIHRPYPLTSWLDG
jgi:hypothetical protein